MLIFGIIASATVSHLSTARSLIPNCPVQKRLALIRIFSFLSVAVTVTIIATGLVRTIIHFMLKV